MEKVFGLCAAQYVTQIDESIQCRENGHERVWKHVKTNLNYPKERGSLPRMREDGKFER